MKPSHDRKEKRERTHYAALAGGEAIDLRNGYYGRGADHPRKYVQGPLRNAYFRHVTRPLENEYRASCNNLGVTPNSDITDRISAATTAKSRLLGTDAITLQDTYLGEKGFIAILPIIDQNKTWTSLDASNNGLRNEAVLHLVDLLLQPQHSRRSFSLDLSRNPISTTAAYALMELVKKHACGIDFIGLHLTKIPKRMVFMIQDMMRTIMAERALKVTQESARAPSGSKYPAPEMLSPTDAAASEQLPDPSVETPSLQEPLSPSGAEPANGGPAAVSEVSEADTNTVALASAADADVLASAEGSVGAEACMSSEIVEQDKAQSTEECDTCETQADATIQETPSADA